MEVRTNQPWQHGSDGVGQRWFSCLRNSTPISDSDRKCRPDDHYHIYTIHQHSRMVIVCTGLRCLRRSAHLHFQGPPREAFLYFRNFKEPAYDPVTVSSGEAAIFHKRCPIGCPLLAILLELGLLLLLRVPDRLYETRLNCAQFEL